MLDGTLGRFINSLLNQKMSNCFNRNQFSPKVFRFRIKFPFKSNQMCWLIVKTWGIFVPNLDSHYATVFHLLQNTFPFVSLIYNSYSFLVLVGLSADSDDDTISCCFPNHN